MLADLRSPYERVRVAVSTMELWWSARPSCGKTLKETSGASWENGARRSACATILRSTGTHTRIDASLRTGFEALKAKQRNTGARASGGNGSRFPLGKRG